MMISPNSLVRQEEGARGEEEGARGEEEEEAGARKKAGSTGTPTPGADAPAYPTQSGVSDARNRRKHGRWFMVLFHRRVTEG